MEASKKPLGAKLGIKAGQRVAVLHPPKSYKLSGLPARVELKNRLTGGAFDLVQAFYEKERVFRSELGDLRKSILASGSVWVCWKKGGVTDLDRDSIAALALKAGLEGVATCAVSDEWSALRLMLPAAKRKA